MTVHSGIFGPVHTGNSVGHRALRRRLEPCSTTSATGPSRCVPPPCGTTAPPKSGAHPSARTSPFVLQASPCPGTAASHCLWPSLRRGLTRCIRRKKSVAVGATLARRCPGWDQLALGWESLGGRFFPWSLPLSWSVPFPLFLGRSSRAFSTSSCRCHPSVASPAFCSLCCLGSPRLPETQIEGTV